MYRNLQILATLFYILSHKMRFNHDGDQRKPGSYTCQRYFFGSKMVFFPNFPKFLANFCYFLEIFRQNFMKYIESDKTQISSNWKITDWKQENSIKYGKTVLIPIFEIPCICNLIFHRLQISHPQFFLKMSHHLNPQLYLLRYWSGSL